MSATDFQIAPNIYVEITCAEIYHKRIVRQIWQKLLTNVKFEPRE